MKNLFLLTASIILSISILAQTTIGSGNVISETRDISGITEVLIQGSVKVLVKQSDEEKVVVTADDNVMKQIETKKDGQKLVIDKVGKLKKVKKIEVVIWTKNLAVLTSSGSSDIKSDGFLSGGDMVITLQGSGNIDLSLNYTNVEVKTTGSGKVSLLGSATNLKASIFGSGNLSTYNCKTVDSQITIKGSGNAFINADMVLNVNISGSGNIKYKGNAAVSSEVSGSGTVAKEY